MNTLTLHVLSCGHGDTLLLQMPEQKWALVDCNLPGKQAHDRFFQFADTLGVTTLDYVVLTHPDSDHYKGMADVLEHFATGPRSVRFFCDSGGNHEHVIKLLASRGVPSPDISEYVRLIKTVNRLQKIGRIDRHWLNNQTATIRIVGKKRGFSLVAVGPEVGLIASAQDSALLELGGLPDINTLSIVLVVQIVTRWTSCRMLLPADMEGAGMTQALLRWDSHPDNVDGISAFDVIKVPHHGSINGHDLQLVNRVARKAKSIAAISCGTSYDLPSRTVVSDYLDRGWRVFCTTPRHSSTGKPQSILQATHLAANGSNPIRRYDLAVAVGWTTKITPADAQIGQNDLTAYV